MTTDRLQHAGAGALTKTIMAVSSLVLVASVVVAALLPAAPDGFIRGPIGTSVAVVAGISLVSVWGAALWHAATAHPWTATVPRWLMIVIIVFGTGVAGMLYYLFYARTHDPSKQAVH